MNLEDGWLTRMSARPAGRQPGTTGVARFPLVDFRRDMWTACGTLWQHVAKCDNMWQNMATCAILYVMLCHTILDYTIAYDTSSVGFISINIVEVLVSKLLVHDIKTT